LFLHANLKVHTNQSSLVETSPLINTDVKVQNVSALNMMAVVDLV
jgi:hypothetical protein